MKLVRITPRGNAQGITIPKALLRLLKWRKSNYVYLEVSGDALIVKRAPGVSTRQAEAHLAEVRHAASR